LLCYYGTWAVYRPGNGKFDVENIDPSVCTHIVYSFVGLGDDHRIRVLDAWNDLPDNWGKNAMGRFVALKKRNPTLKALVAIGGWNEGSLKYSNMAADASSRRTFISSVVAFLSQHSFDGLDLDWEYPANRGGRPQDKQNFAKLLQEMRAEFTPRGWLMTAAVSAGKDAIDSAYDVPVMSQTLDFINVMAYDYHGGWEKVTGLNAPLTARPDETGVAAFNNVVRLPVSSSFCPLVLISVSALNAEIFDSLLDQQRSVARQTVARYRHLRTIVPTEQ
jgi:chitinase